jgi:hypothetical protein
MRLRIFCFLTSLYFLSGPGLYAQPYKSVLDSGHTSWSLRITSIETGNATHSIVGDTVIDDKPYKLLFHDFPNHTVQGFLREDVATGKVWYRSAAGKSDELLVMDLSLKEGDSFNIGNPAIGKIYVDSVYTQDNRKHIRFNYVYAQTEKNTFKFTFIEGVGTSYGLAYKDPLYNYNQYLFCAFKDHNKIYGTPFNNTLFSGDCYSTLSIADVQRAASKDIFVYPDIDRNILRITIPGNDKIYPYQVVNTAGQIVMKGNCLPSIQQDIDIASLLPGTYLFYMVHNHKKIAIKRFAK